MGEGKLVDHWARTFPGGPLHRSAGTGEDVAQVLMGYEALGITGCTSSELTPGSYQRLAPALLG